MSSVLDRSELAQLVALARRALWAPAPTRAALQAANVMITPASFYASIPTLGEIDAAWEHRDPEDEAFNGGLFDPGRMAERMRDLLSYAEEFDPPADATGDDAQFYWRNPAFSYADAMTYYCMIRALRPAGVVEVGSGFSSLVADMALRRNGTGRLTLIEPYPKPFLSRLETLDRLIEKPVQDLPLAWLVDTVEEAGLWFIDSTHTVKAGSDCLWLYLKVMPSLTQDVVVHSHDIFLPFGFPQSQMRDRHIYWTEQYLLFAYLLDNPRAEVLVSSAYAARRLPDLSASLMQGRYPPGGGSLWYRLHRRDKSRENGSAPPAGVAVREA